MKPLLALMKKEMNLVVELFGPLPFYFCFKGINGHEI